MKTKPINEASELELLQQLRDLQNLGQKVAEEIAVINKEINRRLDSLAEIQSDEQK